MQNGAAPTHTGNTASDNPVEPARPAAAANPAPAANLPLFNPSQASADSPAAAASISAAKDVDAAGDQDEVDQLDDSEAAPSPAPSTSSGAVAGPGPSSAMNAAARYISTNKSGAGGSGSSAAGTPAKKKRAPVVGGRATGTGKYVPLALPHYTVKRAQGPNGKNNPHRIVINAGVSDGSDGRWPSTAEREKGHKVGGKESWYECQPRDTGRHKAMRDALGPVLADRLGLKGKTAGGKDEVWTLESLPEGYLFTVHHTVTGSGAARNDVYVFGSPATAKFRTSNEIAPHIYWLLIHGPDDDIKCECKYCGKNKLQAEVNRNLGLSERGSSVASSTPAPAPFAPKPRRDVSQHGKDKVKEEKRQKLEPVSAKDKGSEAIRGGQGKGKEREREREKDGAKKRRISADGVSGANGTAAKKARFADGSASVSPPAAPTYEGAYVNRARDAELSDLFSHRNEDLVWAELPTPLLSTDTAYPGAKITHWPGIVVARTPHTHSRVVDPSAASDPRPPKLETTQEWRYDVRLLGVKDDLPALRAEQVRMWLAHPPPNDLWDPSRMTEPRAVAKVWDQEKGKTKRSCELKDFGCLEEAVTAMALALQIAAHIVGSFSLADRFKILKEHAEIPENISEKDRARLDTQLKSWAFQSVHWGAERIWVGDFVRLMHNTDVELPLDRPPSAGSKDRALFLKIFSLYMDADTDRVKLGGDIWELRDLVNDPPLPSEGGATMSDIEKISAPAPANGSNGTGPSSANGVNGAAAANGVNGTANGTQPRRGGSATPVLPPEAAGSPSSPSASELPPPPEGYVWRPLTHGSHQVHCEIEFLAGRYHPLPKALNRRDLIDEILATPELKEDAAAVAMAAVNGAAESSRANGAALSYDQRAVVLAGLKPAFRLYMKCGGFQANRFDQIVKAEQTAATEVAVYFEQFFSSSGSEGNATPKP
ncbi:hypothetical protein JCM10213_006075 [Rhodosporidiobolus nylandii]